MKKFLMFFIPIAVVVIAVFVILSNTSRGTMGAITTIDNDTRIITIKDGMQDTKLEISNTTQLLDIRNQPTIFSEFNVGFEVEAWLKQSGSHMIVEKVKITKAPNIVILSPSDKDIVKKEFVVKGSARVFENVLQLEVTDKASGQSLYKKSVMASPLDIGLFGPFETEVNISSFETVREIQVSAFQYSAKDGSITDKTTITLEVN
jgi:Cu/Ag efflux protein CusF